MTASPPTADQRRTAADLWESVRSGNRRDLARALSHVERGGPGSDTLMARALAENSRAHVVGITGSPGVGKSTLTSALIAEIRGRGRSVAVLAIDPSSPFSGGAVLGDRIRMHEHTTDPGVFIRSAATRGQLGGLSPSAHGAVVVLEAAGSDVVLIETVGVGQSEVSLIGTADSVVVAVSPGAGDSVQTDKAGIMEIADLFVVNKADQPGAGQMVSALSASVSLGPAVVSGGGWRPPVLRTVAVRGEGVGELVDTLDAHLILITGNGELDRRRTVRAERLLEQMVLEWLRAKVDPANNGKAGGRRTLLADLAGRVVRRELDIIDAAGRLLAGSS